MIETLVTSDNTLTVGGNIANGQWISKYSELYNGSLAAGYYSSYNISSYLPNDNYNYEVLISVHTWTTYGSAAGYSFILLNDAEMAINYVRASGQRQLAGNTVRLLIPASSRTITIANEGNLATSGTYIRALGYRRVGTNNDNNISNYISNINDVPLFGDTFDGAWTRNSTTLLNGVTFTAAQNRTVSVASYLPADGFDYLVLLNGQIQTTTTQGNNVRVGVSTSALTSQFNIFSSAMAGANRAQIARGNTVTVVKGDSRSITFTQIEGATSGAVYTYAIGYKKLGTNT